MKQIILTSLIAFCALSCAKTEPLGPGVSVDRHGNLKIDAPLYVIDRNPEKPGLKRADASLNREVSVELYTGNGEADPSLEITGGIINGRLSITIPKPEEDQFWTSAEIFLSVPEDLFKTGSDTTIGELYIKSEDADKDDFWLILYSNPVVELLDGYEFETFEVNGDRHYFIYSLGDIDISGRDSTQHKLWQYDYDLSMRQGWNVIRYAGKYDEAVNADITTITSVPPSPNAVWVMWEGW